MCFSLFMVVLRSLNTTRESRAPYVLHAVGNRDGGQAAAIIESMVSYALYAVTNCDGGQTATIPESMVSYARHAVGDNQIGYLTPIHIQMMGKMKWIGRSITKRNLTPCLQIRDMNGGQAAAA